MEKGIITDWDGIEELWTAYFEEMELDTEAQPMLVLDSPFASDASRERLTQLMFETFNAPSMYIDTTAACSLYASGRTTGIVLESGMGASHVVPFYEVCNNACDLLCRLPSVACCLHT